MKIGGKKIGSEHNGLYSQCIVPNHANRNSMIEGKNNVGTNSMIPNLKKNMNYISKTAVTLLVMLSTSEMLLAQNLITNKNEVCLSSIKGASSRYDTLFFSSKTDISSMEVKGDKANFFRIATKQPNQTSRAKMNFVVLVFEPSESFIGTTRATLEIESGDQKLDIGLTGLSTKGLEGKNEPPLADVVDALGYKIDVGWVTLANHLRPELQGEELAPSLFKKAALGNVDMIPVARYSPDFLLNFGYYTHSKTSPIQHQLGILSVAGDVPEHQTLFPALSEGQTSFDPGIDKFGFYALSPSHALYSEDSLNTLYHPNNAAHAVRIYPVRNKMDKILKNTYLICMEEAANGDYNDYVFLVKNVEPVFFEKD